VIKDDYNKGGINFFDDGIVVSGNSNLQDGGSHSCNLRIESNASVTCGISYGVFFRMGILEESGLTRSRSGRRGNRIGHPILFSRPKYEMGVGLALGEARVFCETLYKLENQNSETNDPVEISFSGDNKAAEFMSRSSYVKRLEGGGQLDLAVKIYPAVSKEGSLRLP
jgi:hypothetical protein